MAWNRPTLLTILQRIQSDIGSRLEGSDPFILRYLLYTIAKATAAVAHGLYGHQLYIAKQIIPNPEMDIENLERQAFWRGRGMTRNTRNAAAGPATALGNDGAVIEAGKTLQRSDGIEYTVDAEVVISGGTATITVTAVLEDETSGQDSNALEGQTLNFTSPIPGVQSSVTVAAGGLVGGTDIETPEQLYDRLSEAVQEQPQGGSLPDYIKWAKEIPGVTRVWPFSNWNGAGTVGLYFVRDADLSIIPDAGEVQTVQDHIDTKRPVGMKGFTAYAPTDVAQAMVIQITPNTTVVQDAITAELIKMYTNDAQLEDGNGSGTILLSHIREAISIAAGETDHILVSPVADITYNTGELGSLGLITFQAMP